ncbi:MAG: aminoglycoside phosphotransferase family protein [Suipraeoptans sp.]
MEDFMIDNYINSSRFLNALKIPEGHTISWSKLAQGEYNLNILFRHPISEKQLVLRINYGSQMHLTNQIEYEYNALKDLETSGHTPKVFYVDGSLELLPHGVLVMEYLPGRELNYKTDLYIAAKCLADIHSQPVSEANTLIKPKNSLSAILSECENMFKVYEESPLGDNIIKKRIRMMLDRAWNRVNDYSETKADYKCCINTELNSTNFLINGQNKPNYVIDWEKPVYSIPAQDIGHFLAPTTTFWKTYIILEKSEAEEFVSYYIDKVNGRFNTDNLVKQVDTFIPVTCMRGLTWCAMAWVQYQSKDKGLTNESTKKKLEDYLSSSFLDLIEENYS